MVRNGNKKGQNKKLVHFIKPELVFTNLAYETAQNDNKILLSLTFIINVHIRLIKKANYLC